jgi:hypothetical protein
MGIRKVDVLLPEAAASRPCSRVLPDSEKFDGAAVAMPEYV